MEHLAHHFTTQQELRRLVDEHTLRQRVLRSRSVLVQLFMSPCSDEFIVEAVATLQTLGDEVVIVGGTTMGEICGAEALSQSNVVSFNFFDSALLRVAKCHSQAGNETTEAASLIAMQELEAEPLKGILLLATADTVDVGALLAAVHRSAPALPVYGGSAGDDFEHGRQTVFAGSSVIDTGWVAVALFGEALEIQLHTFLGWAPMGRPMRVTSADKFSIHTLDGRPAFEAYRHYLGIEADEKFFVNAVEFPLLMERDGRWLARVPNLVLPDGSITFTAEMRQDEVVHFGYASVQGILAQGAVVSAAVREFAPQAIHLYSCGCRRFLMQEDVQLELAPFAAIAPTAGFFTFGEFCHLPEGNPMLNAALVVAAMREGPAPSAPTKAVSAPTEIDLHLHSHVRILSRFQHFSQAITRDLEQANRELAVLADHDSLTGLPNRRKLHSLLAAELARVSRYSEPFCIAMCDADHFKRLNDQFGHGVGDETLKVMARTLREECREADMVCRYGGEEFLILMPATRLAHAIACIERVRTVMESVDLRSVHPDLPPQTMSFGIAAYGEHGDTESALLSAADAALYQAKRSGRNRVCVAVAAAAPNDGN